MSSQAKKKAKSKGKKAQTAKAPKPKVTKTKKDVKVVAPEKPKATPKPKKVVEKKEAPVKVTEKAEPVVLGPPPAAAIASRHIDSMRERPGRGFSFGELDSASVPLNTARREGLSLDVRRRSVVERNVEALKDWLKGSATSVPGSATETVAVAATSKKK